jgi:23S rRNA pseudouridine1911/1915/1917 synthase
VDERHPGAKEAKLAYRVIDQQGALCLVRAKLLTGRYHQIRVQFAHVGCGVYGDMKYGKRDVKEPLALFAQQVCLFHPTRGEHMCFELTPRHHPFEIFEV